MKPLSDAQFSKAVEENISVAGVIRSMGRAMVGTSYRLVHEEVKRLGLDTSHWKGRAHATTRPLRKFNQDDLVTDSNIATSRIKKVILREGLIHYTCSICGCEPRWMGKPLVLRLDHKDGIRNNHSLTNLRFLCPNCDSQTSTFCGRNIKKRPSKYCSCGKKSHTGLCVRCSNKGRTQKTKVVWPPTTDLIQQVRDTSYVQVARHLGVSDNAIRKHLRSRPLVVEGGRL